MTSTASLSESLIHVLGGYARHLTAGDPLPATAITYATVLPEVYRRADTDGDLLGALEAILAGGAYLAVMFDAINYIAVDEGGPPVGTPPSGQSILTDAQSTLWPEWLAFVLGVDLARAGINNAASDDGRHAIETPVNGWRAGGFAAIEQAASRTLTGTRTVRVRPHLNVDPWIITVSTVAADTGDPDALEAAVTAVLPAGAGVVFDHAVGDWWGVEATIDDGGLEATGADTWTEVEALFGAGPDWTP